MKVAARVFKARVFGPIGCVCGGLVIGPQRLNTRFLLQSSVCEGFACPVFGALECALGGVNVVTPGLGHKNFRMRECRRLFPPLTLSSSV